MYPTICDSWVLIGLHCAGVFLADPMTHMKSKSISCILKFSGVLYECFITFYHVTFVNLGGASDGEDYGAA